MLLHVCDDDLRINVMVQSIVHVSLARFFATRTKVFPEAHDVNESIRISTNPNAQSIMTDLLRIIPSAKDDLKINEKSDTTVPPAVR